MSFGYWKQAFAWKDVRLEASDPPKQQEPTEELIQDLLTMMLCLQAGCMAIEPKVCASE